jgi:murein hydrolase activator
MRYAGRLLLSLVLAGGLGLLHAAPDDLAVRQSDAEKQQAALRTRIEVLQKAIDTREAVRKEAADNLRQSTLERIGGG